MIRLVRIELIKIFHHKSIYIIFLLMGAFCLLNNYFYAKDYDTEGNYKYEINSTDKEELSNLEIELKKYSNSDVNYVDCLSKIEIQKIKLTYDIHTWQYKLVDSFYDIIYEKNYYSYILEDEELYREYEKKYQEYLSKLEEDDYFYFLDLEINKLENEIKIETDTPKEKLLSIEKDRKNKKIIDDNGYLNQAFLKYYDSQEQLEKYSNQKKLSYSDKLEYYQLKKDIAISLYILNHKTNYNKENTLNNCLRDIVLDYQVFLIILSLIISSMIIAEEFQRGTIKLLLIKPYSRKSILCSKYLAVVITLLISIIYLILIELIFGGIFLGFSSLKLPVLMYSFTTNRVIPYSLITYMGLMIILRLPFILFFILISFFIGIISLNMVTSFGGGMLLYLFYDTIYKFAVSRDIYLMRYTIFMNLNLSDYWLNWGSIYPYTNFSYSVLIYLIYFGILIISSYFIFTKKNIKNV